MEPSPNPILIRPANVDDLAGILYIYNDVILNTTAVYQYKPHTLTMRREWFEKMKADGFPVFVAAQDNEILGFSYFGTFRAPAAYKFSVENTLHVHPLHRGKGVGKLLMPPLINTAKQMNFHAMIAGIDAINAASIKLHERFGFVQVAHFKQVGYKFGKWLDLAFFELILDDDGHA